MGAESVAAGLSPAVDADAVAFAGFSSILSIFFSSSSSGSEIYRDSPRGFLFDLAESEPSAILLRIFLN